MIPGVNLGIFRPQLLSPHFCVENLGSWGVATVYDDSGCAHKEKSHKCCVWK